MVPPSTASGQRSDSSVAVKEPVKDTILTPRFYTTDFEAMADMDLRPNEAELEAICEEFRKDYNRHHFVRNDEFDGAADKLDPDTRKVFIEFLEQSCTSEFSGFLLFLFVTGSYVFPVCTADGRCVTSAGRRGSRSRLAAASSPP